MTETFPRPSHRPWIIAGLLALLIHLLFFVMKWDWIISVPKTPPRIEVQEMNKEALDKIKEQWKRQLLISKNQPKSAEAPKNAEYESDRNVKVEREQRAAQTDVLPKPGKPGSAGAQEEAREQPKTQTQSQPFPKLSDLGLLSQKPRPQPKSPQIRERAQQGAPGADQTILNRKLPVGSENLLNTVESKYYSFYARLYESIAPIWQSRIREVPARKRVGPGDYYTRVNVIMDAEGNLIAIEFLNRSGVPDFDQAVQDSWKRVGRFPNPPKDLLNQQGEVHTGWTFTVQVGEGMNWNSLPPERQY